MKLYEFQGKELFAEYGIPIPKGSIVRTIDEIKALNAPLVLKSQVLSGGRGKAGGVVLCNDNASLIQEAKRILGSTLKGEKVNALLVEEKLDIVQEYYLSIAIDGEEARKPLIMASIAGGMEIEKVAEEEPHLVLKQPFNPLVGICDCHIRKIANFLDLNSEFKSLRKILRAMDAIRFECDATLVEINPLAKTPAGLFALDSKITLDNDAKFRQGELFEKLLQQQKMINIDRNDAMEMDIGSITYVPLDGDIGLISDGAGTGMLAIDLIQDLGGKAADFCEMGGLTSPEVMYKAMEIVFSQARDELKSLLIVLIGGFNRMDEMAEGIIRYSKDHSPSIPFFTRLCGTMEEKGNQMLKDAGFPVFDDLDEAIKKAVDSARGAL